MAPRIAQTAGDFGLMIGVWVLGGVLSLIGSLCFAELATRYRDEVGGDYVYLKKAYGRSWGFLFAWAAFWIIRPGNIGAMAFTFGRYLHQIIPQTILPGTENNFVIFAILAVVLLTGTNLFGLSKAKWIQNLLTVGKVVGIVSIVGLAVLFPAESSEASPAESITFEMGAFWSAMILVMFAYGGWNDISFVAAEVTEPRKNLFRSLFLGVAIVTLLYVLLNWAFVFGLGFEKVATSEAVATDLVTAAFGAETTLGQMGGGIISALVCISCLGAINAMIMTSPRIYYALGKDFKAVSLLANWDQERNVPWPGILLQAMVTLLLVSLCIPYEDAFFVIFVVTAPYFWLFLGLVAISLIVLRFKPGGSDDGFRVPLFPLPPLILASVCFAMVYAAIAFLWEQKPWTATMVVGGIMIAGVLIGGLLSIYESKQDE